MTRIRAGLVGVFTTALVALSSGTALAQSADSSTEQLINGLNAELLAIAIPITILVEAILIYTVWRYRDGKVEEAQPTKENRRLEITWTIATALVLLFVGFGAYGVMAEQDVNDDGASGVEGYEVEVDAQQFYWTFHYPNATNGTTANITTNSNSGELVLPKGTKIRLNVSSTDVIHAFHAPELGLKADAFPGRSNYISTTLNTEGDYQLYCAEYCGTGHSQMMATVNVTDQETFDAWLANKVSEKQSTADSGGSEGNTTSAGNETMAAVKAN